jgi:hypothetical protein
MGAALLAVALLARGAGWPTAATAPLLFCAGAGHAVGFSPLAHRLTTAIHPAQVADLSGLILTSSVLGQVAGVAGFVGIYLSLASHGSASALATTTTILAGVLALAAAGAALERARSSRGRAELATELRT